MRRQMRFSQARGSSASAPGRELFFLIRAVIIAVGLLGSTILAVAPARAATCDPSTHPPTNTFPGTVAAADNFESGALSRFNVFTLADGTATVSSMRSHSGACAALLHTTTADNSIAKMWALLPDGTTESYADGWFNIATPGASGNHVSFFSFFNGTDRVIDLVRDNTSGDAVLRVTSPEGTSSPTVLVPNVPLNSWHHVALHVVANGPATGVQVWFNDRSVFAATTLRTHATALTSVQMGAEYDAQMGDIYVDDVVIKGRSGTPGPIPGPDGGPNTPGSGSSDVPPAASAGIQEVAAANAGLGAAVSAITCTDPARGCRQEYQNGVIAWSPAAGAHKIIGGIGSAWTAARAENGRLGYPTTDEQCGLAQRGCRQVFQGGVVVWSPTTGSRLSIGAIGAVWAAAGSENGRLGYPTSNEVCGLRSSGCLQTFQGGVIAWSPATGARVGVGGILTAWTAAGAQNGRLGYPTSSEICGLRNGGCYQMFQGGAIIWSPTTGSRLSVGGIRTAWASTGFEDGRFGYPTTDEYSSGGEIVQNFQGGRIIWSPVTGIRFA